MLSFFVLFILLAVAVILCVIVVMQNSAAINTLDDCLLELRALRNEAVKSDEEKRFAEKAYKLRCADLWDRGADNDA